MSDYQQTDTVGVNTLNCGTVSASSSGNFLISAGATAGTTSRSVGIQSAGSVQHSRFAGFITTPGGPGTSTWAGACTMRFNVTTANSNITWGSMGFCELCGTVNLRTVTTTATLAIGFGTTGVKTASVESTSSFVLSCNASTAAAQFTLIGSNAAAMTAVFNWVSDQIVTLPFTSSAAPATTPIASLTLLNSGF